MSFQPLLSPTTPAQVSGHRFLLRRIEHGVALGDIRMIHDPLGRRMRAAVFGLVGCVLLCVGAGAMALFAPRADPGEAPIVVADSGALFVRVQGRLHPVANLTSAQLIVGAPERPARVADEVLGQMPRGIPLGLIDAPGVIASESLGELHWSACANEFAIEVRAQSAKPATLSHGKALLVESVGITHLVTSAGRRALPPGDSPEGRVIRRRLGITSKTPLWKLDPEMMNTIAELPPVRIPPDGELWITPDDDAYLMRNNSVIRLTAFQHDVFTDLGFPSRAAQQDEVNGLGDAFPLLGLPENAPTTWLDSKGQLVCATDMEGTVSVSAAETKGAVEVNEGFRYRGPGLAVPVDTGHGWMVVSDHGRRHEVTTEATLQALGLSDLPQAPWPIIRLLPEGAPLQQELALKPLFS